MQVQFSSWAMRRLIDCNWYPMYVKKIFVQLQLVSRYSNIFLSKRDFFALPIYNNMGKTWKLSLTYYVIYVAHNYKPYYLSNGEITLIDTCQTHPIICYFNQCFHQNMAHKVSLNKNRLNINPSHVQNINSRNVCVAKL